MTTMTTEPFLTPKQVAERLGISTGTLAQWRYLGLHLPYHKIGGRIRYDRHAIDRYIKATTRRSTGVTR